MKMEKNNKAWKKFEKSGKIIDYLNYKKGSK